MRGEGAARLREASPYLLAGLLTVTGSLHFVVPEPYAEIEPDQLPSPYGLVYASGVAVLPANVPMAIDARLPLQGGARSAGMCVRPDGHAHEQR